MRYIGSKARVVEAILDVVGAPAAKGTFVDSFCGTGVVAREAARRGWSVRINDTLTCATVMAAASIAHVASVPFIAQGGYSNAINLLNQVKSVDGHLWREYSPASVRLSGVERKYFTEENAAKLDAMRATIALWRSEGSLSNIEERLLLADVLSGVNSVANIAGTYGCFLREFVPGALAPVELKARQLFETEVSVDVYNGDAADVPYSQADVAYFDPPYTKRQYAAYYHILETVVMGDEPEVTGVTGLRPWKEKTSAYCYKRRALKTLAQLVEEVAARRVVISYSSEGHISLDQIERRLDGLGQLTVHQLGTIGRYRPNSAASKAGSSVNEYLIELVKPQTKRLGKAA